MKPVDNYDEYFPVASSNHFAHPDIFDDTPRLLLELPSEESSRRPSKCSVRTGSTGKIFIRIIIPNHFLNRQLIGESDTNLK